jgi:hypothetical protein
MNNDSILTGGDVLVEALILYNYKQEALDLTGLFLEIQIFEDLYCASLSGNISLIDTLDVVNSFPIIGEETLLIKYKTAGFPDIDAVQQVFTITKMTDQIILGPHKRNYTLHFTTTEAIVDLNVKLSKAYTGTPTKIIEKILGESLTTQKDYTLDESSNNIKVVAPFWSPFKMINYVSGKAMVPDTFKMSNFIFFETNLRYRFASLNTLFEQPAAANYFYNNDPGRNVTADGSQRDVLAEMTKIYELRIDSKFDQMERLYTGAYSHSVWDHNLLFKKIDKRYYHYDNNFGDSKHLDKFPVDSENYVYDRGVLTSTITTIPFTQNEIPLDNGGRNVVTRIPLMHQLGMMKMDITVHGRTDVEVGDCVMINVGGIEHMSKDNQRGKEDYYNGKYLVSAIMHRITLKKHLMVMQVCRESINAQYSTWSEKK